jgi:DNA adenine methylase
MRGSGAEVFMTPLTIQPIPYQGSKRLLAPRITRLFPKRVGTLYEPFAGSGAITIYAAHHELAKRFVIGDVHAQLIDLWEMIINRPDVVWAGYRALWEQQHEAGLAHFNTVRNHYNASRDPVALLYLIARCVKNAIRFNRMGDFTQSVDKRRKGMNPDKMELNIRRVSSLLRNRTQLFSGDFADCIADASARDLVYMDPPYQGTTYGNDKRYVAGLERERLIKVLHNLNNRSVGYILSYDGKTGDKEYGEPLPHTLGAKHLHINAGRSSQATLSGRAEVTLESLYVSSSIAASIGQLPDYATSSKAQHELFSQ